MEVELNAVRIEKYKECSDFTNYLIILIHKNYLELTAIATDR